MTMKKAAAAAAACSSFLLLRTQQQRISFATRTASSSSSSSSSSWRMSSSSSSSRLGTTTRRRTIRISAAAAVGAPPPLAPLAHLVHPADNKTTTTNTKRWYSNNCVDDYRNRATTTTTTTTRTIRTTTTTATTCCRRRRLNTGDHDRRPFSSLAAVTAAAEEEEEVAAIEHQQTTRLDEDDDDDDGKCLRRRQQQQHEHQRRRLRQQQPRLEALRRRLRREEEEQQQQQQQRRQQDGATASSAVVSVSRWNGARRRNQIDNDDNDNRTTTSGCSTTTATATTDEDDNDTERLLRLVERLPDPPPKDEDEHATSSPAVVLADSFGRFHDYLRISLTERCNLRCTYCMPEDGVPLQPPDNLLTAPEILELAGYFVKRGVRKFRLTGGEPTLRKDLVKVVEGLSELNPAELGMTTNGVHFSKLGPRLVEAGLTAVNISLDTIDPTKFEKLTRRPGAATLERVMAGLETALQHLPPHKIKINCVVMRGTNDDPKSLGDFIRLQRDHFPGISVRFIEYMPFSSNGWNWDLFVPYQEMLESLDEGGGIQLTRIPSPDPHDTTKWYTTTTDGDDDGINGTTINDNTNKIGFITSMSSHFCATCNRIRLTADGQIKVCLFDGGSSEISLRDILRHYHDHHGGGHDDHYVLNNINGLYRRDADDATATAGATTTNATAAREKALDKIVYHALRKKHFKLGGHVDAQDISDHSRENRPMTLIGG